METRQNLIEKYYAEDYQKIAKSDYGIDEDGFSNFYDHGNETHLHGYEIFSFSSHRLDVVPIRPLGLGKALEDLKNNNGWIKTPVKGFLSTGFYFIRLYVPETNIESFITHEVKESDAGMIGYHYATHYKRIDFKPPIY
jgi:hypothetical protein